jgi:hypothetical protein
VGDKTLNAMLVSRGFCVFLRVDLNIKLGLKLGQPLVGGGGALSKCVCVCCEKIWDEHINAPRQTTTILRRPITLIWFSKQMLIRRRI